MINNKKILSQYNTIYQISTFGALVEGCLDGFISLKELRKLGNFGIGGITGLDGEITCLDGEFYHLLENGSINFADKKAMSPRMTMSFFKASRSININQPFFYNDLQKIIESSIPSKNIMYAIKIIGDFTFVKTKCYPKQNKPYPRGGVKIASSKKIFEMSNIRGTMIGYFMPEHLKELGYFKYHFHFLSADKKYGGHIIDFKIIQGNIEIDDKHNLFVSLPKSIDYYKADFTNTMEAFEKAMIVLQQ